MVIIWDEGKPGERHIIGGTSSPEVGAKVTAELSVAGKSIEKIIRSVSDRKNNHGMRWHEQGWPKTQEE